MTSGVEQTGSVQPEADLRFDRTQATLHGRASGDSAGRNALPGKHRRAKHRMAARHLNPSAAAAFWLCLVICNGIELLPAPQPLPLAAGLLLVIALPTWLTYGKLQPDTAGSLRFALSLGVVVLGIELGGLLLNELLLSAGVTKALGRVPLLLAADAVIVGLRLWRRHARRPKAVLTRPTRRESTLLGSASVTLALSVAGPIRLNNGLSGGVTLVMLVCAGGTLLGLLAWRSALRESAILGVIYLIGLSLLMMTSLRGWDVTGHDIQREFQVFQLAAVNGNWQIGRLRDPYNACMSITILPTVLQHVTGLPPVWIFKTLFQLLFALCPLQVYLLARRHTRRSNAILASAFFMGFPTYFTDMPYINRQEVALYFVGAILLVVTELTWTLRRRRLWVAVLSIGAVLSHYSTTYVLIAVLGVAWFIQRLVPLGVTLIRSLRRNVTPARRSPIVLGLANILLLTAVAVLWTGPLTNTGAQLEETASAAVAGLTGSGGDRSADVTYSLVPVKSETPQDLLARYRSLTLAQTAQGRAAGIYLPLAAVQSASTPALPLKDLPLSPVGRTLSHIGINVSAVNSVIRAGAARLLQVLVCIGLLIGILRRRLAFMASAEFVALACGSLFVVAMQVVLPAVSVDYGVLRAFQQGLFLLAPFVVSGSTQLLAWVGRRAAMRLTAAFTLVFFWSLTGVIPQLLGGYPPQLQLNNAGQYYDIYYVHPQERTAINWLQGRLTDAGSGGVQAELATDRYTFRRVQNYTSLPSVGDIFPTLLRTKGYVFLGYSTTTGDQSTLLYQGTLLTYRYPLELLSDTKDVVYSNGGATIFSSATP